MRNKKTATPANPHCSGVFRNVAEFSTPMFILIHRGELQKRRDVVNKVIAEKGEIAMTGALLMEISQDEHQRAKYRSRRMFETDKFHNEATAEERGGNRAKLEMARNLKNKGISNAIISEASGLNLAEVEKA